MVPLIINPIYSLYIGFLSDISPLKGVFGGLKQLGYHPKGTTIFPYDSFREGKVDTSNTGC